MILRDLHSIIITSETDFDKYISKYECIYKYMVKADFRSAVQISMDDANKFRLITC